MGHKSEHGEWQLTEKGEKIYKAQKHTAIKKKSNGSSDNGTKKMVNTQIF